MKSIFSLVAGLALVAGVIHSQAGPADSILGLVTPEIESLSSQPVQSFTAPTANCLAHKMTSIQTAPRAYVREGVLNVPGHEVSAYATPVTQERLFIVTPELAAAASAQGVEIRGVVLPAVEVAALLEPAKNQVAAK